MNKFILGETAIEAAAVTIPELARSEQINVSDDDEIPSRWRRKPPKTCGKFKFGVTIYTVCNITNSQRFTLVIKAFYE